MILTCPSCGTQYSVRDGAIPAEGRRVRCATCGHSWHQEPEEQPGTEPERAHQREVDPVAEDTAEREELSGAPPVGEWPGIDPDEGVPIGEAPSEPLAPGAPLVESPQSVPIPPDEAVSWGMHQADESPEELAKETPDEYEIAAAEEETPRQGRRNWWLGIAIGLVVVVLIAGAFWFFAPDSLRRGIGLASASPMPLQIAAGNPERQKLASGNELVVVSGRVLNPSSSEQPVPPIAAELHDKSGRLVYSWTIAPPARTLPPGGSASFNSAEVDVPASGPDSTITFSLKR